jgi:hypothetical protein
MADLEMYTRNDALGGDEMGLVALHTIVLLLLLYYDETLD